MNDQPCPACQEGQPCPGGRDLLPEQRRLLYHCGALTPEGEAFVAVLDGLAESVRLRDHARRAQDHAEEAQASADRAVTHFMQQSEEALEAYKQFLARPPEAT